MLPCKRHGAWRVVGVVGQARVGAITQQCLHHCLVSFTTGYQQWGLSLTLFTATKWYKKVLLHLEYPIKIHIVYQFITDIMLFPGHVFMCCWYYLARQIAICTISLQTLLKKWWRPIFKMILNAEIRPFTRSSRIHIHLALYLPTQPSCSHKAFALASHSSSSCSTALWWECTAWNTAVQVLLSRTSNRHPLWSKQSTCYSNRLMVLQVQSRSLATFCQKEINQGQHNLWNSHLIYIFYQVGAEINNKYGTK